MIFPSYSHKLFRLTFLEIQKDCVTGWCVVMIVRLKEMIMHVLLYLYYSIIEGKQIGRISFLSRELKAMFLIHRIFKEAGDVFNIALNNVRR